MMDALAAINSRIVELEAKLAASPVYRELTILSKARDDLQSLTTPSTSGADRARDARNIPDLGPKRVTILEAAKLTLADKGYPMTTAELVESLPQFGARVGGKNPRVNLTSLLSKRADGLVSIRWRNKHTWWFRDRPLPNEEAEGTAYQHTPSAPNSKQGRSYAPALDD